jgi:tyrosyl-tRNA synthetase
MSQANFKSVDEQLAYLKKGTAEIIREDELKAKLAKSLETAKPLRVYLGVDPTAPDLHLGHTVVLRKLKHFQDMGHTAVFLIGDFSAMIGDPTGVSETRPPLTREQVDANAKTYLEQVFKILDRDKTEVRYNSEWLGKMSAGDVVRLCSHYRLARMLEREDFRSRLDQGHPISVHELLYPLLTAIDAVNLKSDVELGATEQKFNLLVHREIQREYGLPGQVILTMPILVGLDGQRKMSKSLGNYIGITEAPDQIFGKMMSIPDELMWSYYELLTDRTPDQIAALKKDVSGGKMHPMDAKMQLAQEVIAPFHGQEAARKAADSFQRVFRDRQAPEEVRVQKLAASVPMRIPALVFACSLAPSRSEAERLVKQKAIEIDGEVIDDPSRVIDLSKPREFLLRAGKKNFVRVVIVEA